MTQLSLVPKHWLHLQCAYCRHQANVPVATFIAKGLQTIAAVKNNSSALTVVVVAGLN